jgi:hypothetical protein
MSQEGPTDLICDLDLSDNQLGLLVSKLKGQNLLEKGTMISLFHKHQKDFLPFFSQGSNLA